MRFTKMILAMSLAFAFSASHANDVQETCKKPENLAPNYAFRGCLGEKGWFVFADMWLPTSNNAGIMDAQGKILLPAQYFVIDDALYAKNMFTVSQSHPDRFHRGLLDENLTWILPIEYQTMNQYEKSPVISVVREKDGEAVLALFDTQSRQFITPFKYTKLTELKDGMIGFSTAPLAKYGKVNETPKLGFVNEQGKEMVAELYPQAGDFSEGVNWVEDEGGDRWLIDKTGKKLWKLPYHYVRLSPSQHGLIVVQDRHGKQAVINHAGEEIVPFERFDWILLAEKMPIMLAEKHGKYGLFDLQGKVLLPEQEMDGAEVGVGEQDRTVVFYKGGQFWRYDEQGKLLESGHSAHEKACAAVKLGDPHPYFSSSFKVSKVVSYRNYVEFSSDDVDYKMNGECGWFASSATQKSTKFHKKHKK